MASHIVAVYDVHQRFGGREEGGWWYNTGSLVRIVKVFKSQEAACKYCRRLNTRLNSHQWGPNKGKPDFTSTASRGWMSAEVYENHAPLGYPNTKPRYE